MIPLALWPSAGHTHSVPLPSSGEGATRSPPPSSSSPCEQFGSYVRAIGPGRFTHKRVSNQTPPHLRRKTASSPKPTCTAYSCEFLQVFLGKPHQEWSSRSSSGYWKETEVARSCPTLCDPMDCSIRGASIHGIFQARILEWVAISFFRGSFQPRDWAWVSYIAGRCFTIWATRDWRRRLCQLNHLSHLSWKDSIILFRYLF